MQKKEQTLTGTKSLASVVEDDDDDDDAADGGDWCRREQTATVDKAEPSGSQTAPLLRTPNDKHFENERFFIYISVFL